MMSIDAECYNRTALILTNSGLAHSFSDAETFLRSTSWTIGAGWQCGASVAHQAALLTAVNTAARAAGHVGVRLSHGIHEQRVVAGVFRGDTLVDAIIKCGGTILDKDAQPDIVVGDADDADESSTLEVSWCGWNARVAPLGDHATLHDNSNNVVPAIAAGALAVNELFQRRVGKADAGDRQVNLCLWTIESAALVDTPVTDSSLPGSWWLIGLGHLGQAYAWVLSWLYVAAPPLVYLQDGDVITGATLSTGLLTRFNDVGDKKVNVVGSALSKAGFSVQLSDQRVQRHPQAPGASAEVAVVGVDNVVTRQILSFIGSPLCVDAGIGGGHNNFTSVSMHVFPGRQRSDEVVSWREHAMGIDESLLDKPAYREAVNGTGDRCGVVQLAGRQAAATFVGAVTGCLVVSEVLRRRIGGPSYDGVSLDIRDLSNVAVVPSDET